MTIPAEWVRVGETSNADIYEAAPDILVISPHANCVDTEQTARESVAFQDRYWRANGRRGAVVVLMDQILSQEGGARAVYVNETRQSLTTCYALVGETFFGQVVSSVFTGMAQPGLPTRVFPSIDAARPWIEEMNRAPFIAQ